MKKRKIISVLLLIVGVILSISFILKIQFPLGFEAYFKREYYKQFGPLVLSIELLIAGYYLFQEHKKANFTLALFGFTALLYLLFNQIGLFVSLMPLYGTIIISICALLCLWITFSNSFKLSPMTLLKTIVSFILGVFTELFFNL
jgi:cbb3-type cytochrome oxidase subunit 3